MKSYFFRPSFPLRLHHINVSVVVVGPHWSCRGRFRARPLFAEIIYHTCVIFRAERKWFRPLNCRTGSHKPGVVSLMNVSAHWQYNTHRLACWMQQPVKISRLISTTSSDQPSQCFLKNLFLGTRGAVLHHSAETVLCFRNHVVLLSCCLVLLSCCLALSKYQSSERKPMV